MRIHLDPPPLRPLTPTTLAANPSADQEVLRQGVRQGLMSSLHPNFLRFLPAELRASHDTGRESSRGSSGGAMKRETPYWARTALTHSVTAVSVSLRLVEGLGARVVKEGREARTGSPREQCVCTITLSPAAGPATHPFQPPLPHPCPVAVATKRGSASSLPALHTTSDGTSATSPARESGIHNCVQGVRLAISSVRVFCHADLSSGGTHQLSHFPTAGRVHT